MPSPVQISAFVLGSKALPTPPDARMTDLAETARSLPVSISIAITPLQTPSSTMRSVTNHSS